MTREEFDEILDRWTGFDSISDEYDEDYFEMIINNCAAYHDGAYCNLLNESQLCCLCHKPLRAALWAVVERAILESTHSIKDSSLSIKASNVDRVIGLQIGKDD